MSKKMYFFVSEERIFLIIFLLPSTFPLIIITYSNKCKEVFLFNYIFQLVMFVTNVCACMPVCSAYGCSKAPSQVTPSAELGG